MTEGLAKVEQLEMLLVALLVVEVVLAGLGAAGLCKDMGVGAGVGVAHVGVLVWVLVWMDLASLGAAGLWIWVWVWMWVCLRGSDGVGVGLVVQVWMCGCGCAGVGVQVWVCRCGVLVCVETSWFVGLFATLCCFTKSAHTQTLTLTHTHMTAQAMPSTCSAMWPVRVLLCFLCSWSSHQIL